VSDSLQPPADPQQAGDPDWWQSGVVYQLYPRSYADASGDGIGDLPGIVERLEHLGPDGLGVDAVWLSPIFPSPDFDFGYDVSDYTGIDSKYGTLADFERFVEAAHRRGMRVILDLVLNHSSSRHPWFEASRASRDGPYADWYIWRDSPGRSLLGRRRPPNNWRSWFGGSAWTWEKARGQFYMHTFHREQPDLNWRNPAVREALLGVVRTWLDRGVDGFRLDVFNVYFKDAELRSNPRRFGGRGAWSWQRHLHDRNQADMAGLLRELRAIVDERPGRMTVGELFDGRILEAAGYVEPRHLIFDWTFISLPWSAAAFKRAISTRDAAFGPDRWPANVLSNHDQPRHAGVFAEGVPVEIGDARAKVAAALLLTLRGTPFLYYGEELALRNLVIPNRQALDPPARRANPLFPWWNRDQARGPLPWRPGPGAGFTTGRPWLPLPPDAETRNVEAQAADPESVLSFYRSLIRLRRTSPAILRGNQTLLDLGPDIVAFTREASGSAAFVALNFGSRRTTIAVPSSSVRAPWRVGRSTHRGPAGADPGTGEVLGAVLTLEPLEALVALAG
jgi:alpha-glucosidase